MKIKEIIQKTDLTDRAIRLYIENGLVHPRFTENYNGRKNIDFTEDDLKTLQNIAILRKADFSISEIRSIIESSEKCKEVLRDFIRNKTEKIENDTKILEALSPLLGDEEIDINSICKQLNTVTADKTVPDTDTKTPLWEKIERWFFLALSGIALIFILIYASLMLYFYTVEYSFRYPHGSGLAFIIAFPVAILLIALYYFLQYRKPHQLKSRKKKLTRPFISLLLIVPLGYLAFFSFIVSFLSYLEPLIDSQTTKLSNYLIVDDYVNIPKDFFPEAIPEFAKPKKHVEWLPFKENNYTVYFYRYSKAEGGAATDIVAEWRVYNHLKTEENFHNVIKRMQNRKTRDGNSPVVKKKGDWTLYYYADTSETELRYGYTYLIFAYDEAGRMRYIYSNNTIKPIANGTIPHYLTLDWYS